MTKLIKLPRPCLIRESGTNTPTLVISIPMETVEKLNMKKGELWEFWIDPKAKHKK